MRSDLILGDCLDKIRVVSDNSVDLILTSPPYDNLRDYEGSLKWDFEVFSKIANELKRVLKQGGVIVWVVGDSTIKGSETGTSFRQVLYFKDVCGLNIHDTMIWQKAQMPKNHNRYEQFFEYMFVLSNGKPNVFNGLRDRPNVEAGAMCHVANRDPNGLLRKTSSCNKTRVADFGLRYNIWAMNPCLSKIDRNGHPAPFPEQLARDHILSWTNEGSLILDPFMGSGTVGKQAKILKRDFVGIECVEEYFNIAKNRIENVDKELTLF